MINYARAPIATQVGVLYISRKAQAIKVDLDCGFHPPLGPERVKGVTRRE